MSHQKLPFLFLLVFSAAFIIFFYGKIISEPNDYMFSVGGDGIKNYYTYAYHIKHDSTYTNFEGMNYPYGENYLYTDCHPILANGLKFLKNYFPFLESHSIGIMNVLMILSIFFTFIIIYLLLIHFKLNKWFSVFFSISITLLAPQLFRMDSHMALSYSVAIPLAWLLLLKTIETPRKRYYFLFFLLNLFWMFIHAYLGMIVISFVFAYLLFKMLLEGDKGKKVLHNIWLGLGTLLPVIIFYIYTKMTDTHVGRTDNPGGFFHYNAEIDDVLVPHEPPFRPLIDTLTDGAVNLKWEAWGYLGMMNTILFVSLVVLGLVSIFRLKTRRKFLNFFDNKQLNRSLLAAFLLLLFALAIPFKQIPGLLDIFPIIKQFRATGRFVWPFYFVFTVYAAYVFQEKIYPYLRGKNGSFCFLTILISVSLVEGYYYHLKVSSRLTQSPNHFKEELLSDDFKKSFEHFNASDYQAILTIPFYYQGSESFAIKRQHWSVKNSIILSYHSGLPNICAGLTRTSIEESRRIVQLLSPNYYPKKLSTDIKNAKPFLMLKTRGNLSKYDATILAKGKPLYQSEEFDLLSIEVEDLFSDDRENVFSSFRKAQDSLQKQDSFYVTRKSSVLYYDGFEQSSTDIKFRGKGSFVSVKKGKNVLATFPPNTFEKGKAYDFSIWMYHGEQDALNRSLEVMLVSYDASKKRKIYASVFPEFCGVLATDWSLLEGEFVVDDPSKQLFLVSIGPLRAKADLHADDLLVKEKGIDVYKVDSVKQTLFFNNHRVRFD